MNYRMKNIRIKAFAIVLLFSNFLFAGNEDRAGEAGAGELLINPWGRSSGWGSANTAGSVGVEAMHLNIAGLAYASKTELNYSNTNYLSGTDIRINSVGLAQKVGDAGVLGISVMN